MAWFYLTLAGAFEIAFTTAIRFTDGFSKFWPSLVVLLLASLSIYFVSKASATMPLGTAYAVWGAFGAIGTAIIGILYFDEPVTLWRMAFLSLLIISIVGLKLVTD
jgi:quaternary ammonium compound-resistance protein SugE